MRMEAKQERGLTVFFFLSLLPLLPACWGPYALTLFFGWPIVLGYMAYGILALTAIYNDKPVVGAVALGVLIAPHAVFTYMGLPKMLVLELPSACALLWWLLPRLRRNRPVTGD